jgi:hypothetical protein
MCNALSRWLRTLQRKCVPYEDAREDIILGTFGARRSLCHAAPERQTTVLVGCPVAQCYQSNDELTRDVFANAVRSSAVSKIIREMSS